MLAKKTCQHLLSDNNAHILCKEWLKSCNLSYFMQGSLSVSQSELHPMRIKFPYSLVCVLSLTRYIYAQKINERDLLHAHSSVGVSYLHADPQCIYSSWDSFFEDDRNNILFNVVLSVLLHISSWPLFTWYIDMQVLIFDYNVFNVIHLMCDSIDLGTINFYSPFIWALSHLFTASIYYLDTKAVIKVTFCCIQHHLHCRFFFVVFYNCCA